MKDRPYEIARNHGYDRYQRTLASAVCKFFDKITGLVAVVISKAGAREQLADELHKPVTKKFKRKFKFKSLCEI